MTAPPSTAIIGAGITGLTLATALRKSGAPVRILEQASGPGGVIATSEQDGCLVETGPSSPPAQERGRGRKLPSRKRPSAPHSPGQRSRQQTVSRQEWPPRGPAHGSARRHPHRPLYTLPQKLRVLREPFIGRPPAGTRREPRRLCLPPPWTRFLIQPRRCRKRRPRRRQTKSFELSSRPAGRATVKGSRGTRSFFWGGVYRGVRMASSRPMG